MTVSATHDARHMAIGGVGRRPSVGEDLGTRRGGRRMSRGNPGRDHCPRERDDGDPGTPYTPRRRDPAVAPKRAGAWKPRR